MCCICNESQQVSGFILEDSFTSLLTEEPAWHSAASKLKQQVLDVTTQGPVKQCRLTHELSCISRTMVVVLQVLLLQRDSKSRAVKRKACCTGPISALQIPILLDGLQEEKAPRTAQHCRLSDIDDTLEMDFIAECYFCIEATSSECQGQQPC